MIYVDSCQCQWFEILQRKCHAMSWFSWITKEFFSTPNNKEAWAFCRDIAEYFKLLEGKILKIDRIYILWSLYCKVWLLNIEVHRLVSLVFVTAQYLKGLIDVHSCVHHVQLCMLTKCATNKCKLAWRTIRKKTWSFSFWLPYTFGR